MILNPNGPFYDTLKNALKEDYEDLVWAEDAIFLERNSRDFKERSYTINQNAEALCDFLIDHPLGIHIEIQIYVYTFINCNIYS